MVNYSGKTVFVSGATGFLGGHLVRHLSERGASVRALARREGRDQHIRDLPNVEIMMADLNETQRLIDYTAGCDVVMHAAVSYGKLAEQRRVNVTGTRNIALAAAENGVARFVHISTIAVYGFRHTGDITEQTTPLPAQNAYSITKLESENAVRAVHDEHGLPFTILRPGFIYGPRSSPWTDTIFRIARQPVTIFVGRGRGSAHPVFVDDVCDLALTAGLHPAAAGEVFNVTPDPAPTWREFLGAYQQIAGRRLYLGVPPVLLLPVAYMAATLAKPHTTAKDLPDFLRYAQQRITYRMKHARAILGWQAKTSLQEGIAACVTYLRERGLL